MNPSMKEVYYQNHLVNSGRSALQITHGRWMGVDGRIDFGKGTNWYKNRLGILTREIKELAYSY